MHVDVSNLLHQEEGSSVDYNIEGEEPTLDDVILTSPLGGHLHVAKINDGVSVSGRLRADVELQCHRCLRSYVHNLTFPLRAEYADRPTPDEFAIEPSGEIILDEAVRQEILVHLPQQHLCAEDCAGIKINKE